MKKYLPLLLLVIFAFGCGKSAPDTAANSNSKAANKAAAPEPTKLFDMPAMVGKSRDEVKKMITQAPKSEEPWLEYRMASGDLTVQFKNDKASDLSFTFRPVVDGSTTISGLDTADQLGSMIGVDVKGKIPKSTMESFETFEHDINGNKIEVVFNKIAGKYAAARIDSE